MVWGQGFERQFTGKFRELFKVRQNDAGAGI